MLGKTRHPLSAMTTRRRQVRSPEPSAGSSSTSVMTITTTSSPMRIGGALPWRGSNSGIWKWGLAGIEVGREIDRGYGRSTGNYAYCLFKGVVRLSALPIQALWA